MVLVGNDYRLSIQNQFFKDELNKVLGSIDASLPMIRRCRERFLITLLKHRRTKNWPTITVFKLWRTSFQLQVSCCNHYNFIQPDISNP